MVEAGLSFMLGALIGALCLMLAWGLLWMVVGAVGLLRGAGDTAVFFSSVSSSIIAILAMAGLRWGLDASRFSGLAWQIGLLVVPSALALASLFRLQDGRRIGPAFVGGSRRLLHHVLGAHRAHEEQAGCGQCHERPCEEKP